MRSKYYILHIKIYSSNLFKQFLSEDGSIKRFTQKKSNLL